MARKKHSEVVRQMSMKLEEIKPDLNSQVVQTINAESTDEFLPSFQGSVGTQEIGLSTKVDLRSKGLHRNPKLNLAAIFEKAVSK